jgi:hypothetical protein
MHTEISQYAERDTLQGALDLMVTRAGRNSTALANHNGGRRRRSIVLLKMA